MRARTGIRTDKTIVPNPKKYTDPLRHLPRTICVSVYEFLCFRFWIFESIVRYFFNEHVQTRLFRLRQFILVRFPMQLQPQPQFAVFFTGRSIGVCDGKGMVLPFKNLVELDLQAAFAARIEANMGPDLPVQIHINTDHKCRS